MQTLENLNKYFEIFEAIVFEGKGFARVGKDYGISVAAVHARYEYIRMAVCRELLLLPPSLDNAPLIRKLFEEDNPNRDILTVLRACKDEILFYYRNIRAKMKYKQYQADEEEQRAMHFDNVHALHSTCLALSADKKVAEMLKALF